MSEASYALALTLRVLVSDKIVPWGSAADTRLKADMHALLAEGDVNQHVWQRARGYMKTTSAAVAVTAELLTDAPANSVIQVYANDGEQAGIIMRAIRTIVDFLPDGATPPLRLTANSVTREDNGAQVRIETSDAASALGSMNLFMLVLDEFANWEDVPSLKRLWDNVYSGVPKTGDTRVLIVTSAGPIGTWAYERLMVFQKSKHWRYSWLRGCVPWRTDEDLAKQREGLSSLAAFRMFHLNEFTSGEDALVTEDDLSAAVCDGVRERAFDPSHRYVVTADLSIKRDATVITVCHREGGRVVQDVQRRWLPRLGRPVPLVAVRDELLRLYEEYGRAPIRVDPRDAGQMVQEAQAAGVLIETVTVDQGYNHRCTMALQMAFDQHRLDLLDIKEQSDEMLSVVVKTSTAGGHVTLAIDSSGSGHDDQADALAMAVEYLMANPWFDTPVVSNLDALAVTQVKRATGDVAAPMAARERVRLGPRDRTTPPTGQPRQPVRAAMSAYDRFRQRTGYAATPRPARNPEPETRYEGGGSCDPTPAAPPAT